MNKLLQIIGAEVIANQIVKLTCIPFTSKEVRKKKKSILSMAMEDFGTSELVKEIQGEQQQKSILYITQDEWRDTFKNKLYSCITVSIDLQEGKPGRR